MTKTSYFNPLEPIIRHLLAQQASHHILTEVVYGLVSRDCKGMGICKIKLIDSPNHRLEPSPCGSSLALIHSKGNGQLHVNFVRSSISRQQYRLRFSKGYFELEGTYCFSSTLVAALDHSSEGMLKGKYPITWNDQFAAIEVNLY